MFPGGAGPHSVFLKCKSELKVGYQLCMFMHLLREDHTISLETGFEALEDINTSPFVFTGMRIFSFFYPFSMRLIPFIFAFKKFNVSQEHYYIIHSFAASLLAFEWSSPLADHE